METDYHWDNKCPECGEKIEGLAQYFYDLDCPIWFDIVCENCKAELDVLVAYIPEFGLKAKEQK